MFEVDAWESIAKANLNLGSCEDGYPMTPIPECLACSKYLFFHQTSSNCAILDSSSAEEEQGGNWQSAMQYHETALENLGEQGSVCNALRSLEFQSIHGALGPGSFKH